MSSSAQRVARLISRIADERAARGRPVERSRAKVARSYSTAVLGAPESRGSAAEFGSFELGPSIPPPVRHRRFNLVYEEYVVGGGQIVHPIGPTEHPIITTIELVAGIDYPDMLAAYPAFNDYKQLRAPKTPSLKPTEATLIDRLFAGWSPNGG